MPKLAEVAPPMIQDAHYSVHQSWRYLQKWTEELGADFKMDLDPDFQRGHVWSEAQRVAYLEFVLRGGRGSDVILWNADTWTWPREKNSDLPKQTIILVDGKQRFTTVMAFLRGELKAYGLTIDQFDDHKIFTNRLNFIFKINNLQKRADVLQWYLELNGGGTPHSQAELDRVAKLLEEARK